MSELDKGITNSNPVYGNGIYRRRIRLAGVSRQVIAELEDTTHAFRLALFHDDQRVTDISAEPIRYPFDSCPGALAMLKPLVGCALDIDSVALRRVLEPGQNCTHLYDLALLALAHSSRTCGARLYDISVPDENEEGTTITVACDGVEIHQWKVRSHRIVEPPVFKNSTLKQGFYRWASEAFSEDVLEAALILQRGYFVAQSRRQDYIRAEGRPATADNMPEGACYTYNTGVVEQAIHTGGMGRDFTHTADQLLGFV